MDIIIQSPGFKSSGSLEEFVKERVNKLEHKTHNIIRADVTLTKGPEGEHQNNHCEIRLEMPGYDPFAKKNSDTFEQAVVETVDALQSIIRKSKDKEITGRHGNN